jgi:2-oxoglutarate ferredoxin oxidoreductase subunit alpha
VIFVMDVPDVSKKDISIGMVGSGGDGVISAGEFLVTAAAAEGLYAYLLKAYGPQIRGGESSCRVRISDHRIFTHGTGLDVLVAFNWQDFEKMRSELVVKDGVFVIYEEKDPLPESDIPLDPTIKRVVRKIPLTKIALDVAGTALAKNIVTLGIVSEAFHLPAEGLKHAIRTKFARKGEKVIESNIAALEGGASWAREHLKDVPRRLFYTRGAPKMAITGNEALSSGALYAGCRFYAGYPITPSSEILEWMARELPKFGGTCVQAEDEIAAIGMLAGVSFAGGKALSSTAGPGLSLMTEALGLAAVAELPMVVVNCQRTGPSTGIPTKPEQADLYQALFSAHGDAPRVVMAPIDVPDCFRVAVEAFNIAEAYQTPVIVLSDQLIAQRKVSIDRIDPHEYPVVDRRKPAAEDLSGYERFRITADGVSPMAIPGVKGGAYVAAGIEHDELGDPTSSGEVHERMNEKRIGKLEPLRERADLVWRFGPEDARVGVISWGSTVCSLREVQQVLAEKGKAFKILAPSILYPLPVKIVQDFVDSVDRILVIELNHLGQFYRYLRMNVDFPPGKAVPYHRSGGRVFDLQEIVEQVEGVMS